MILEEISHPLFSSDILPFFTFASKGEFGGRVGLSFQFGTHIQRLGLMHQLYYFNSFVQISQGASFHYNWKSSGPNKRGLEMQALLGLHFNIQQFGIIFENDLFGGTDGFQDKFRTGAMGITYQLDSLQLVLQTTHWTGRAFDGPKVYDSLYPGKYGYRDLSKVKYGKYSHGILSFGINYLWKYKQTLRLESGIDAERVRHALQNRLIHDFPLLPHKGKYENMHYPMLQMDGTPYTFREGQIIRKSRFYLQAGANPIIFY